jgi:hypothetical protein
MNLDLDVFTEHVALSTVLSNAGDAGQRI